MSDMNLTQAADEVRKMLRGFKAIEQVSAALEQVGTLDNAGREAEAKLATVKAQIATAEADFLAANVAVDAAKDEAKKVAADARRKADEKLAKADEEGLKRIKAAEIAAMDMEDRCHNAELRYDQMKLEIVEASAELAALQARINDAKAYLAKLAGA